MVGGSTNRNMYMGFNSAFKGLNELPSITVLFIIMLYEITDASKEYFTVAIISNRFLKI